MFKDNGSQNFKNELPANKKQIEEIHRLLKNNG